FALYFPTLPPRRSSALADRSCETSSPPTSAAPAPNRPESPAPRKSPRPTPRPGLDRPRRRKRRPGLRAPRIGKGSLLRKEPKKKGGEHQLSPHSILPGHGLTATPMLTLLQHQVQQHTSHPQHHDRQHADKH